MFLKRFLILSLVSCSLIGSSLVAQELASQAVVFPILSPKLASGYGSRKHPILKSTRHHNGIDLSVPYDTQVRAVAAGQVVFAGSYKGYGNLITILHGDGYTSLYGHLKIIDVGIGHSVSAGQILGRVGSTGLATGPHLHFEWRKDGKVIDPHELFPYLGAEAKG